MTQAAVAQEGVTFLATDVDINGGKIILTAGAPVATDNDEERMLRAVRRIADEYEGLPIQIGVNRGPAFSGDVGAPFRRTYTVIGDAVNLAARVMSRADHGEVLATADVLDRSDTMFELRELEPFAVKGKTEPVQAWAVGAVAGRRVEMDASDVSFTGRGKELKTVEIALGSESGTGLIEIVGPAGVGKSRLIRELEQRKQTAVWHLTTADQYESGTPYFPMNRLLRSVMAIDTEAPAGAAAKQLTAFLKEHRPRLLPLAPLIATAAGIPYKETPEVRSLSPKFRVSRLQEVLAEMLDAALAPGGALVVEDAHWLDDASRELLTQLGKAAKDSHWNVVVVRRPEGEAFEPEGATRVLLGPLSHHESQALVRAALGQTALADHEIDRIARQSGGNPLFLLQLIAVAGDAGEELPDSIESLLTARIDRLDPVHRKMLRYSSVAGASIDPGDLSEAIGDVLPEVNDAGAWKDLQEFLIRRQSGELEFRQALYRDVAYAALPHRIRRNLHARFGAALEKRLGDRADDQASRLAVHFLRAEEHRKAWRYGIVAGDQARDSFSNVDAADAYEAALKSGQRLGVACNELADVGERLGDVAELAGLYDTANEAYGGARKRLVRDCRDEVAIARLMRKQGLLREKAGDYSQALRWFGRAIASVADVRRAGRESVNLELAYAGIRYRQGRYADSIQWGRRALQRTKGDSRKSERAHAYSLLGLAYRRSGDTRGRQYLQKSLDLYTELDDLIRKADALNNLGVTAYYEGQWNEASSLWQRATEARKIAGDVVGAAMVSNNVAHIWTDQGRLDDAEELFQDVHRVLRAAGFTLGVAVVTSNLGRVASRDGRSGQSAERLEKALRDLEQMGAEQYVLEAKTRKAEALLFAGDFDGAASASESLETSLRAVEGSTELKSTTRRILGEVALRRAQVAESKVCLEKALELAVASGARYEEAAAIDAIARWAKATGDASTSEWELKCAELMKQLDVVGFPGPP